ncbi:MAG TPA: hypothetical protein VMY37_27560 [Thermoguttaceae bacterium]|nr:hypothetical protein [Thermoguttaceae bacterium]
MTDAHDLGESTRPAADPATPQDNAGTLVAWTASTGDSTKSHVVHIDPAGATWALGLKRPEEFGQLVGEATARPAEAAALVEGHRGGHRLPRARLARVTYAKDLNQLTIIDDAGRKQRIPDGNVGEQGQVFEAIGRHLGGTPGEEDADAWSVMQVPLFALAVVGVIGGLLIYVAAISDPSYEASGRRSGMKQLINWLGYTVGPTWMSILVGAVALAIFAFMVFLLVKRPKRQVLDF